MLPKHLNYSCLPGSGEGCLGTLTDSVIWDPNVTVFLGKMFLPTHVKSKNKKSLTSELSGCFKRLKIVVKDMVQTNNRKLIHRAYSPKQASEIVPVSLLKTSFFQRIPMTEDIFSSFFFFSKCNLERVKLDIIMIC